MRTSSRQNQRSISITPLVQRVGGRSQQWRIRGLALLVAAISFLVLSPASGAYAANYDGTCDAGEVCVYNNANYGSAYSDLPGNYPDMWEPPVYHSYNYPTICNNYLTAPSLFNLCRLNDSISSIRNYSYSQELRIFTDAHYSGKSQLVSTRTNISQVTYNDQTSSLKWY